MSAKPESPQWKHEARRMEEANRIEGDHDVLGDAPPRNERIEQPRREVYSPPPFLKLTATAEEYDSLCDILEKLWECNNEFAGDRTLEVEAFLSTTGADRLLAEIVREWCRNYFGHRLRRRDGKDNGDPLNTMTRLAREFEEILGHLQSRQECVNYVLLGDCHLYVSWLLGDHALDMLSKETSPNALSACESLRTQLCDKMLLQDFLTPFMYGVADQADQDRLMQVARQSISELTENLAVLADDIQAMRPFLIKGFDFAKTTITIGPHLSVAWDWATSGMAQILFGPTKEKLIEGYAVSHKVYLPIKIGGDGILCDGYKSWITTAVLPATERNRMLAANQYLLELFHERLHSFWSKVDLDRIRERAKLVSEEEVEQDDELLAASCQQLANMDSGADLATTTERRESRPRRLVRSLRVKWLLSILERHFGCEVSTGKGSEITVYRSGHKKAVVSHHKQNGEIYPSRVNWLLKRLGISIHEFLTVVS